MAYSTINKPSDYFNTKLYTGNSSSSNAISGVGFQPDWTWIKGRNYAGGHRVYDAVRGAAQVLSTSTQAAQNGTIPLTSFDSDGFTIGSSDDSVNGAYNYISWNWLADNTSGSSNTDGTITSTVAANTDAGFSIVKWTGTGANGTVGHGLSSAPKFLVVKRYDSGTTNWVAWHQGLTSGDYYINFNLTDAQASNSVVWNSTIPTSSVFSVGTNIYTNPSGGSQIAYCFSEVKGYSKFGSYTGNGSTDGTFIYTGFKPAFIIMKEYTHATQGWCMKTSASNGITGNPNDYFIKVDTADAENNFSTTFKIDFLSNGIKLRTTDGIMNRDGRGFIYMCFADQTLVGTNNVCATAR